MGKFPDTEFGGKTGTSNNHSDAWFVGVSPKLVCGAWVGGEYRCIHFRTGQLGQGSRTALPICGYFFESVLGDPAFKHYRGKFEKPKDANITQDQYLNCPYIYHPVDSDSIATDSLDLREIDVEMGFDENGNPVIRHTQPAEVETVEPAGSESVDGEATEQKKKKAQPEMEDVVF